ncbi:uncharacterized protein cubi_01302 [Cryptosporidium ubiquitum]|uniref:Uncharacterized protein n=1 Tax=Cryptosporidium ubiquitum TaxID=857276 RepID=A0A1J4MBT1_9CRYT|nr:uncharacterized protein cubi_01302 [Cryptosporidium ubiquitum]OII71688.1 hypothetical protein cubi_01302 [Cryptosporidium ubiquitum]
MNTPSRKNTQNKTNDESLLGSYYRLKSYKKLANNTKKKTTITGDVCNQNSDENAIYTTPIRSSRRIDSRKNYERKESSFLDHSPDTKNEKILITPNPYIRDDIVEELLNDMLLKYKDKIQVISFNKQQPQILEDSIKGEIEDLDTEFNSKLQINDSFSKTMVHENENLANQGEIKFKDEDEEKSEAEDRKLETGSPKLTERKKYFICRNKPRKLIGGGTGAGSILQNTVGKYEVIAENEYWMVVEFPKNSSLYRKHKCSRVLTQKRIFGNPVNCPVIRSIDEYKTLHSEIKQLLELSNYCYSPDLF